MGKKIQLRNYANFATVKISMMRSSDGKSMNFFAFFKKNKKKSFNTLNCFVSECVCV